MHGRPALRYRYMGALNSADAAGKEEEGKLRTHTERASCICICIV